MRVGITVWENQVSPLLDAATQLLLVEITGGAISSRQLTRLPLSLPWQRVLFIRDARIGVLICGAISQEYETMLQSCNVEVIPWIRGWVDEVIEAFLEGRLNGVDYCLPGRRRARRRCRLGKRGRGVRVPGARVFGEEE